MHLYTVPTSALDNVTYSLVNDSTEAYLLDRTEDLRKDGDNAVEHWVVINPPAGFASRQIQGTTHRQLTDIEAAGILDSSILFAYKKPVTNNRIWEPNQRVNAGDTRFYNQVEYECIQSHTTLANWIPPIVPALWKVLTSGCAEWRQPAGAHDAYQIGDCVKFNGKCYESKINANVWSPSVYPAGWKEIPCP